MSIITVANSTTVPELAKQRGVQTKDLWLPLSICPSARATKPFVIKDTSAIVLVEKETKDLFYNRKVILEKIGKEGMSPRSLLLTAADIPNRFELFVQWRSPGRKPIPKGASLFFKAMSTAEAFQKGSAFPSEQEEEGATTVRSVSELTDLNRAVVQEKQAKRQRSEVDREARMKKFREFDHSKLLGEMLHSTKARIYERRNCPPLVFLPSSEERSQVIAGGVRWSRPVPGVLYRVFRSDSTPVKDYTSNYLDASRQLAFFFFHSLGLTSGSTTRNSSSKRVLDEVMCDALTEKMRDYARRGFRLVIIDHLPQLHFSSADNIHQELSPLVEFCKEFCCKKEFSVTVVLSVVSNVSLSKGRVSSLAFPQSGLLNFFISQLNSSFQPDKSLSFIVNSVSDVDSDSLFTRALYDRFVKRSELREVSRPDFLEKR